MKRIISISSLLTLLLVSGCSGFLDTRQDVFETMDRLQTRSATLITLPSPITRLCVQVSP